MPSSLTDPKPIDNQQTSEVEKLEKDTEVKEKVKRKLLLLLDEEERNYNKWYSDLIDQIKNLQNNFSIPPEVYTQPELQDAARRVVRQKLLQFVIMQSDPYDRYHSEGVLGVTRFLQQTFSIPEGEVERDYELQDYAMYVLQYVLKSPQELLDYSTIEKIQNIFLISDEIYKENPFKDLAINALKDISYAYVSKLAGLIISLNVDYKSDYSKLRQKFGIPEGNIESDPELQRFVKKEMLRFLSSGSILKFEELKFRFSIPDQIYLEPDYRGLAISIITEQTKNYLEGRDHLSLNIILMIKDRFQLEEVFRQFLISSVTKNLETMDLSKIISHTTLVQKLGFLPGLEDLLEKALESFIGKEDWPMVVIFIQKFPECRNTFKNFYDKQKETAKNVELSFHERKIAFDILAELAKLGVDIEINETDYDSRLSLYDYLLCALETEKIEDDESKCRKYFEILKEKSSDWRDEHTIAFPFKAGAETFGYKRMFEYIKRKDLSLHDAVHAFLDVLKLYRASGLGESAFYGQILQQVQMDCREYPEGTAHHHLNSIAKTAHINVAEVIAKAQYYKEIERLQELASTLNTPQAVFASWINLKRYSELGQLFGQIEILDELKELKAGGKEKLYRYIQALAFHPDSKVDMGAVMQFWRDPKSFLAAEASHTLSEVHDRKKPSNYLNMPNLDLTAPELRDALVEGKMDRLSAFTPLEIRYTIPLEDVKSEPLPGLVYKALGSKKNEVEGLARNSRKLFSELDRLLKPHGLSVTQFIKGVSLPEGANLSKEIEALLYDRDFGMERPIVKTREFVARISLKSDPEGAIAGDDTVNCMPFGDGKNTLYTFNPNTAQFVIRVVKDDGKERTIAQSVLTKDMDIKRLVPDVISDLQQEGVHLKDILPADILTAAPVYAACDNVEVAPNYSDERHQQIIEAIFRDFFREYMSRFAKTEGLNSTKVPIGEGFTDALSQLPTETNTFAPQAPVSYSDKTGEDVYILDLGSNKGMDLILQKQVRETKFERQTEPPLPKIKGLGYLTFEDTLKVAYLEGKAYSDNKSLMQYLFNIENGLIAKDINNAAKDRPNMCLKYTDEDGRMRGYMLAWEGRISDENVEYYAEEFFNEPCVYIIDLATDLESLMAGGRLIQGFVELYKQNYLDKGNLIPIFAQARETTSYKIVKRQLDKLGKEAGFSFELIELPTYNVGEDTMHPIIIRPVSDRK